MRIPAALAATILSAGLFAARPATKPPKLTAEERAAQSIMRGMSLHDRVAQLVIGVAYGDVPSRRSPEYEKYRHWVHDLRIGGLIINNHVQNGLVRNAEAHAFALFLNQMQRLARTPLIVGADFERGASMRVSEGPKFPYNMAIGATGDIEEARYEGLETAREARALGVQWIFAPVADVNVNPENPVINIRSFGENPEEVSKDVVAYIQGAHSDPKNRVLVTAKHFPGHGDTNIDSHLGLARLDASRERMNQVELKPFEAAIANGVDSIMTAHMAVPAIEPENIPATASSKVLTGLLREELGFKGLIVTDALDMLGFANGFPGGEGVVRALEAGADVLLMPPDPEKAIRAVMQAIRAGRLTRQRIDESVIRVLAAKIRVGVLKKRYVDLDQVSDVLDAEEVETRVAEMSDRAVTLVRNGPSPSGPVLVPLSEPDRACLVVAVGARLSQYGQHMASEFRHRAAHVRVTFVDPSMPLAAMSDAVGDTSTCSATVIAVFSTGGPLNGDIPQFIAKLTASPSILVAVGSPYVLGDFPNAGASLTTFSTTPPSEAAAVKALFGEIAIGGHLPVTIPGFAKYGDGITVALKR
ncbi:MAG TPA: glycoside hydrolase family 3 N-terminal domain-containing protein [Bryobacteraceae bacterium]|nr:glycoside hydrolase family 3 N-terminal domain-containing protein [Bryobacteraceae bacterium]